MDWVSRFECGDALSGLGVYTSGFYRLVVYLHTGSLDFGGIPFCANDFGSGNALMHWGFRNWDPDSRGVRFWCTDFKFGCALTHWEFIRWWSRL